MKEINKRDGINSVLEGQKAFFDTYPTLQSYIDATCKKPKQKVFMEYAPPAGTIARAENAIESRKGTFKVLVIVGAVLFGLGILLMVLLSQILPPLSLLGIPLLVFGAGSFVAAFIIKGKIPGWEREIAATKEEYRKKNLRHRQEVDNYNNGEYLRLLEEYNRSVEESTKYYMQMQSQ